ncbi:MAG TPA: helicase-related protein, partial [Acidimicrobiales bacterium]|nr:helicase-related protein [Acidimicrobiales bacterium]
LAVTLERLEALQSSGRPQRVGLSATQRPIEKTATLLTGVGSGRETTIIDCGHLREIELKLELPDSELGAVASTEQMGEVLDRIAAQVGRHRTTLVFVNTRRMSERIAHELGQRLGAEKVAAHHGSLSKDRRQRVEQRLRAGDLSALVATASLELGIDVGPVELVCQVGSPRSIATFLQRVGRSNHRRGGVPKGIVYPLTRDELVEVVALLGAARAGRLDAACPPTGPLDILAQQVVAEVAAAGEWSEDALFELMRGSAPFADLSREDFDAVIELVTEGITTGRGRRMAYLHRDRAQGSVRPRRGARLAALTSGGAIPEIGDYRVLAAPDDTPVGTVNEDFAIEAMVGDVFLLGTHSWRIRRVEQGVVRVVDAEGAHPTIPFWVGEAPSRTDELSEAVSDLRVRVAEVLEDPASPGERDAQRSAVSFVTQWAGVDEVAAVQLVEYVDAARRALGVIPNQNDVVFERFFDEAGGMQLVIHAPFGGRINRAYGLALRKRFCATFDFELQAAANDDAVVLSLGPQHSFGLDEVPRMLAPTNASHVLSQAVLASPMFASRWRWNLNRALAVLRFRGGRHNPLTIQRMEADDVMAAVFPALAACQENAPAGPIDVPDHVIVRQTLEDCLHEAMDSDGMVRLVDGMRSEQVRTHFVDSPEPSVLSHEILNGKPYTFLDDAPLEERRTRAVQTRRGQPPTGDALARLDTDAVKRVRDEVQPDVRDSDELHDLLCSLVVCPPIEQYRELFSVLVAQGRAGEVDIDARHRGWWCAAERRSWAQALHPEIRFSGALSDASDLVFEEPDADVATAETVRGLLELVGPVSVRELATRCALSESRVRVGLARLESEGFAMRGRFDPEIPEEQWCARRLLARIHSYTQARLRREIEPVTAQDLMRFLIRWQHAAPGTRYQGSSGLAAAIEQLQGFELAAGAWEESVLSARVEHYSPSWLDDLCMAGVVAWGRIGLRAGDDSPRRGASTPSRATPITFCRREDLPWLINSARAGARPVDPSHGAASDILNVLRDRGALFHAELQAVTRRLPSEVDEGLWDLVSRGLVTADGFQAVRALLSTRERARGRHRLESRVRLGRHIVHAQGRSVPGRWSLLANDGDTEDPDELAEAVAGQLLARWGIMFWDLSTRENLAVPWRDIVRAMRRFEARGLVRGGRFVTGFAGEQYALPEAVEGLRRIRRTERNGEVVQLSAADPLNLIGIVVPGERVPAVRTNSIAYVDGLPVEISKTRPSRSELVRPVARL